MTPTTVRRVAQEIRQYRALLTAEETQLQHQEKSATRDEGFRRINFWRSVLKSAEHLLAQVDVSDTRAKERHPRDPASLPAHDMPLCGQES